jgi:ABC-type branched-subunit amino acid transport system ATPase component
MKANTPILEINNLCKKFGGIRAINGLSISIEPGIIAGLLGPNGSGKTTLFNLITGVYPTDSGSIRFRGDDITNQPIHRVSLKGISRTFQTTKLFFSQSVIDNIVIAMIADAHEKNIHQKTDERIDRVLEFTSLTAFKHVKVGELTHASQRHLMVAMALIKEPSLLLLDEITSGMSGEECNGIMAMAKRIKDNGTTIIMIEHNMRVAMALCDHIIVISFGEKIAEGTPEEISTNNKVLDAYLGKDEY